MKIAHIADLHITSTVTAEEWAEQMAVLQFITEACINEAPDYVIIGGDLSNHQPRKATPQERQAVVKFILDLADEFPVFVIRGNHDVVVDGSHDWGFLDRYEGVEYVGDLRTEDLDGVPTVMLPYPSHGSFEEARNELSGNPGQLLFGHFSIVSSVIGTVGQPLIGDHFTLGLNDLTPFRGVFAGHIHKPQSIEREGAIFRHTGSIMPHTFGELDRKGFDIITVQKTGAPTVKTIYTSEAYANRVQAKMAWDGERFILDDMPELFDADIYQDAKVRLTVSYPQGLRWNKDEVAQVLIDRGAASVKIVRDPQSVQTAKVDGLTGDSTTWQKLERMWSATDTVPTDADELHLKLQEAEE